MILPTQPTVIAATRDPSGKLTPVAVPAMAGPQGWSPVLAIEEDGSARYLRVTDWWGGDGRKPAIGYIGTAGVTNKANASNLNAAKRVMVVQAQTGAGGIASLDLTAFAFAKVPTVVPLPATGAVIAGPTRSSVVAGSVSKTAVQIKVEQQALVSGLFAVLLGATANAFVVEN